MNSLYQQIILEHYRNPHNQGEIKNPANKSSVFNPLCGDKIELTIDTKNKKVKDIKFRGEGCVISQASASLLTDFSKGKEIRNLIKLDRQFMMELVGITPGPTRLKCLLLPLEALHKALNDRS